MKYIICNFWLNNGTIPPLVKAGRTPELFNIPDILHQVIKTGSFPNWLSTLGRRPGAPSQRRRPWPK